MGSKKMLTAHIGYRSTITLNVGERVFRCCPGDLHMLTVKNVGRTIRLLDCGAVSHTGMIKQKGHDMESLVITIQNLPAIRLEDGTVTSEDVRNIQSAKAKFSSSVYALLKKAEINPDVMKQGRHGEPDGQTEAELVSLDEPAVIHALTENLFFPKK